MVDIISEIVNCKIGVEILGIFGIKYGGVGIITLNDKLFEKLFKEFYGALTS